MAEDPTYGPKVHFIQGGDTVEVASGGNISVQSGGKITIVSGGTIVAPVFRTTSGAPLAAAIANLATNVSFTTAHAAAVNGMLAVLRSIGALATS